ncbi:MAG: glycerophosphodiester phosphodiesterase family protein [Pseudomonadota bacterium]
MRPIAAVALLATLAACAPEPSPAPGTDASSPPHAASTASEARDTKIAQTLPAYFDCLRENTELLIATHRGGPAPGYPENALETMQNAFDAGFTVFEIDVAESRDGVLFLMHDRTLGRTTNRGGAVADTDWEDIARARLVDNSGIVTDFAPPKLTDVLLWAVENGAIVELDRKSSTSFRNIVAAIRAAGAEGNSILITYDDSQAGEVARLAPDLMLTASARGGRDIARLEDLGVRRENLIAWTGITAPDAAAFRRLRNEGVEPAFGTLGRAEDRLDDQWLADGDASEFEALIDDGLVLLATDRPFQVAELLGSDAHPKVCQR